jgi:cation diffusion facilitator family transporter
MKLAAYFMSGVIALLAEALHTLSDIFVVGFLLVAMVYSRREADREHMFGHGRAQNVAALVAATLFISFTSFKLYEESIPRLFTHHEATYQNLPLAMAVLVVSMLIAAAPLVSLIVQKQRGAAAKAQLMELINDELGLLAVLAGTLFIMWGEPLADPIAALVVATIIAVNAVGLFRENFSFLVGRSPGADYMQNIESLARSVEGVVDVHDVRAEYIGPETIHMGMHLVVPRKLTLVQAVEIEDKVRHKLHEGLQDGFCYIDLDPAPVEADGG